MTYQNEFVSVILAHIVQFSLAISLVAALTWFAGRRWPHFAFLVCMLALAKCMVPPLITSPAGIFTRTTSLAFSPRLMEMQATEMIRLKHVAALASEDSLASSVEAVSAWLFNSGPHLRFIALFFWITGAILVMALAYRQYAILLGIVGNCRSAPERVQNLAQELKKSLGISVRVAVLVSNDNYGPACVGYFRPKLILPSLLVTRWSDRLIRPILAHELVHARRGDCVWGILQFVVQIVWWFHPLVWWLGRRSYLFCERCCDEEVVSSRQFTAAEYAESLVRVLELKSAIRVVPHCSAMSPAKITRHRLEPLMKRYGRFSNGTSRLSWILAAMLALLLIPGMHWARAKDGEQQRNEERNYLAHINSAIASGDWTVAMDLLQPVVANDPQNANAIFYLGYVLHAQGRLDEAIVYHQCAANFQEIAPKALYNWACALALQGKNDAALEKLTKAIELGFMHETDLTDDADLKSLFEREEFKNLRQQANNLKETGNCPQQFDFQQLGESYQAADSNQQLQFSSPSHQPSKVGADQASSE